MTGVEIDPIEDFIREYKGELGEEEVRKILKSPWSFLKLIMEEGKKASFRFMYIGVFKVHPKRFDYLKKREDERISV